MMITHLNINIPEVATALAFVFSLPLLWIWDGPMDMKM
jgi:hypothetical protein